jgi:hypothetical protein
MLRDFLILKLNLFNLIGEESIAPSQPFFNNVALFTVCPFRTLINKAPSSANIVILLKPISLSSHMLICPFDIGMMLFKPLAILLTIFPHLLFKINLFLKNCFTVLLIIYFSKLFSVLVGPISGHIILINSNPVLSNVFFWIIVFFIVVTNVFTFPLVVSTFLVILSFLKLCFLFSKIILLHHLHALVSPPLFLGHLQ